MIYLFSFIFFVIGLTLGAVLMRPHAFKRGYLAATYTYSAMCKKGELIFKDVNGEWQGEKKAFEEVRNVSETNV